MKKKKFNKKLKLKKISVANLNEIKGEANNINRSFGYCGSDFVACNSDFVACNSNITFCVPTQQTCDIFCGGGETVIICH